MDGNDVLVTDLYRTPNNPFVGEIAPITASDDEIRQALAEDEVPPLLPALAYLTGDLSLLRANLRPDPMLIAMPQAGLTEEQQAEARQLALDTLIAFRDGGSRTAGPPSDQDVLRIMEFAVGGTAMDAYLPLLEEELTFRGEDRRGPGFQWDETATPFNVVI